MKRLLPLLLVAAGCAHTPRPVPPDALPGDRLLHAEKTLLTSSGLTATFELDSKGENPSHYAGTLELISGNALHLTAEGHFKSEAVQVELDSRDAAGTHRATTKGPSVSSHRDPPAPQLREALAITLVRMGLLHNLVKLTNDAPIEKAEGGVAEWVKAVNPKDGASEAVGGEPCRRVDFELHLQGQQMGEASLCIADQTGLPLQRNLTVHFPSGDMQVTESYKWQVK